MDLTRINQPFGVLQRHAQLSLMNAWLDGEEIECWNSDVDLFYTINRPQWNDDKVYRVKPKVIEDSIDWSHVSPEYRWMARDKNGSTYLYEFRPYRDDFAWTFSDGDLRCADGFASYKKGNIPWDQSLIKRP